MTMSIIGDLSTLEFNHKMETIMVEGIRMLNGMEISSALLMGIIYSLNLSFLKELKYTCEVSQT